MRHILLATTLAAAVAVPALADAQTRCQQQENDNRVAGTVVGAIGGALLGSAIAGRHDRGAGAVVGGVGGAIVGNSIASNNGHCPDGYVAVADPNYAPPPPPPPPGGYPYAGAAPTIEAIHGQEDMLLQRIDRARERGRLDRGQAAGLTDELHRIQDRERDLRDRHAGRLTADDRFYLQQRLDSLSAMIREDRAAGAPPPPPPPPPANLWAGAPQGMNQRADWLQSRITDDANRRILTRAGVTEAQAGLDGYRTEAANLRARDGGQLRDVDRQYLSDRLDYLARRIQYMEQVHR